MSNGVAMDIDFLGVEGGRLAMAFAAGCAATWAFLRTTFTAPLRTRITELEGMVAAERKRCEAMETRLVQRIPHLSSEERRLGKEWVRTVRYGGSAYK